MSEETTDDKPVALRDARGRMLAPLPGGAPAITPATAHEMHLARKLKRMRLYAEGAQNATIDAALVKKYGDDAHVVARAQTLQEIATTPDAGKAAVMADNALQRAQGWIEDRNEQGQAPIQTIVAIGADALAQITAALREIQSGVVDADAEADDE